MENFKNIRKGLKDIWWQSFMVKGATFGQHDIPCCPTKLSNLPKGIVTYEEAKQLVNKEKKKAHNDFEFDLFVCFYIDDYKFDSTAGIWFKPEKAYDVLKHFKGIITPDFSTYTDFPEKLKGWNIYRDRAFGYWWGNVDDGKYEVIPNVRGDNITLDYCFEGIDKNSVVAIGTVGSNLKFLDNQYNFSKWLYKMYNILKPHTIIVYGSANYPCFKNLVELGVNIVAFPGKTSCDFKRRDGYE